MNTCIFFIMKTTIIQKLQHATSSLLLTEDTHAERQHCRIHTISTFQFHSPHHAIHPLPGQVRPCARHLSKAVLSLPSDTDSSDRTFFSSGKACCWLPVPCRWMGLAELLLTFCFWLGRLLFCVGSLPRGRPSCSAPKAKM